MKTQRNHARHHIGLILALASLMSVATLLLDPARRASAQAVAPSWSYTGNLNTARSGGAATLLQNGKVLVAGGSVPGTVVDNFGILKSAELFDPATGTWSVTGNLNTDREGGTATLLPDGKVLVAGGFGNCVINAGCRVLNSAELYDPATGMWSSTGNLNTARDSHTATLLPNGKVLVAAGLMKFDSGGLLNTAELYDPAAGTWSNTGNLNTARNSHSATLLPNGKVLVAGGGFSSNELSSAELYNPATETWSITGNLNEGRSGHSATLLQNGKVLVAGNSIFCNTNSCTDPVNAELYDPTTETWSDTDNPGSFGHTTTLLPSGKVLLVMDKFSDFPEGGAELYDPATGTWSATAHLNTDRSGSTATLLPNGKVLVAGGSGNCVFNVGCPALNSAELYDPGTSSNPNPIDDAQFFVRQQYHDFLGREPDSIGFQNWVNTLVNCPNGGFGEFDNPNCDRVHVSAGFYLSEEFRGRGYWAYRFYQTSLGRAPLYTEFIPDLLKVGGEQSPQQEAINKQAFTDEWVNRAEFKARYDALTNPTDYLDELLRTAGVTLANRDALVSSLQSGQKTRAQVLREIVESKTVEDKFFIEGFVSMQYFGYLRRDLDPIGYNNWVRTLRDDPSNFRHMIFGFIYSSEYRQRFGP